MQQLENDPNLNWVINTFETAIHLHFAYHAMVLDFPNTIRGLPPDKIAAKKFILEKNMEDMSKLRDETIESAIHAWKVYKENRK